MELTIKIWQLSTTTSIISFAISTEKFWFLSLFRLTDVAGNIRGFTIFSAVFKYSLIVLVHLVKRKEEKNM